MFKIEKISDAAYTVVSLVTGQLVERCSTAAQAQKLVRYLNENAWRSMGGSVN